MTYYATQSTPIGPFTTIVDDETVLASGWTDDEESLRVLIHPTLRPSELVERAPVRTTVLLQRMGQRERVAAAQRVRLVRRRDAEAREVPGHDAGEFRDFAEHDWRDLLKDLRAVARD